jgi:hypothetical protein
MNKEMRKKEDTGISARCLPEGRKCAVGTRPIDYLNYPILPQHHKQDRVPSALSFFRFYSLFNEPRPLNPSAAPLPNL